MTEEESEKGRIKRRVAVVISLLCVFVVGVILLVVFLAGSDGAFEITSVEILYDGSAADNIEKKFTDEDFILSCRINGGKIDVEKQKNLSLEWYISEDDNLGCGISEKGLFTVGNRIGSLTVKLKAKSRNTLEAAVKISVTVPEGKEILNIETDYPRGGAEFIEGQRFDPGVVGLYLRFEETEKLLFIPTYTYYAEPLQLTDTEMSLGVDYLGIEEVITVPITVKPKTLQSVEISRLPDKTSYTEGEYPDLSGMEVICRYEYISETVTDYFVENRDAMLTKDIESIKVSYSSGGVVKTAEVAITVARRSLKSIEIVTFPDKLKYIQGQKFRPDGIKVLAHFEYIEADVTDKISWDKSGMLRVGDGEVTVSYSENGIEMSESIPVTVDFPYSAVRKIMFENPLDATLSWIFSYSDDGENESIDNTQIDGHSNLLYDPQNGIYIAPVGAVITVMRVSPAITGFTVDGKDYDLIYPASSIDFELDFGDGDLNISFGKVIGNRITIRFSSDTNGDNWAFVYPFNYSGTLRESELFQIASVYEDTEKYCYKYRIGDNYYGFEELCTYRFDADALIIVTKTERALESYVKLNVVYPEGTIAIAVDRTDPFAFGKLPERQKTGYSLGFSLSENGEIINAADFGLWLDSANDGSNVYAVYELTAEAVVGDIVGSWSYSHSSDGRNFSVSLDFNADGTYSYVTVVDGKINCSFYGVYSYEEESIKILSLEYKGDYQLISINDFYAELQGGNLRAPLFITEGITVLKGETELQKEGGVLLR